MKERIRRLYKDRNRGISMAVVLCLSAFFVVFAAAIIYTAGLLTAQANSRLEEEQCYQLAKSYAAVLDRELTAYQISGEDTVQTFYDFANAFLDGSYAVYDPENPQTVYSYQPTAESMPDPAYGTLTVNLYKEADDPDGEDVLHGTLAAVGDNYTQQTETLRENAVIRYVFTVDVIVKYKKSSYTYSTKYYRKENYPAIYRHDGQVLVWGSDECWHTDSETGAVYTGEITPEDPVSYTLDTEHAVKEVFEPVYKEAGQDE